MEFEALAVKHFNTQARVKYVQKRKQTMGIFFPRNFVPA